ncbi:MAG: vWA domain-containing protein [Planctomycetota bacterium]|jgi:hypothetical protein
MEWLTPMTALYAAAAAVPLLLLLYFLKLKRREEFVPSTLLWKRAIQDLQVNAPFQRIRRNILLLIQLLVLLAILLALAGPILSLAGRGARRYVLLIDRSASMNAADANPNRLDFSKKQAGIFVEALGNKALFSLRADSDQVMVMAFDNRAKVMCNFTSDKRQLLSAIEAITPGDGSSSLAEAVVVARAFTQSAGVEAGNRSAQDPARLILFSDGRIHDLDQIVIGSDELVFNCIGESEDNIGITAMQARRSYENPEEASVFATLTNYGDKEITCDVQLSLNNDVLAVRSVNTPPRSSEGEDANKPGKATLSFSLSHSEAGVIGVRHTHSDYLAQDDAAWAVLPPPKKLSVLLVTAGNMVLESALRACPLAGLELSSPSEFDARHGSAAGVEPSHDVVVLDNFVPVYLPRCRYLVFGRPPEGIDVSVPQQLENQIIVDWRPRHPLLKHVNLMNLFAAKCYKMDLPRDAEVLAEFNETPALALLRRNGSTFLLAGFDVLQTNWPFELSFILFCYNAMGFLGTEVAESGRSNLQIGQPIVVEGLRPDAEARIHGPGLSDVEVKANSSGSIRFPTIDRVGVYSLELADQPPRLFAVNLLDSKESDIKPVHRIAFSGQQVEAQQHLISRANVLLLPFLIVLAIILVLLEWLVYNYKVRI